MPEVAKIEEINNAGTTEATTKYLDDAQVGYENDCDDARAGSSVGFASERVFPMVGFCPRRQLDIWWRGFLVLSLKTVRNFTSHCFILRMQFASYWFYPHSYFLGHVHDYD